jgi:hypothetical protein
MNDPKVSKREGNRMSMTNLTKKRSCECDRDHQNQNLIESNGRHENKKGQTILARERIQKQASPRVLFTSKGAKFESKRRATHSLHDQANERAKSAQTPHQLGQRLGPGAITEDQKQTKTKC